MHRETRSNYQAMSCKGKTVKQKIPRFHFYLKDDGWLEEFVCILRDNYKIRFGKILPSM